MSSDAIVIGAGPAGLTTAYQLSKLGISSTVLEADHQVGGISRTVNYRGFRFDIGGHRFFSKVPLINELWREILDEDFLLRPRMSRIHYRGQFFDYPLKATNALARLGLIEAVLVALSYAKARAFPGREETTFEQWVSNRFGDRLYRIFFKTYTEKVWGIPCNEISADWAAQRIKNLSLVEAVRHSLLGNNRSNSGEIITTLIDQFHYPRHGPGMMWECCEKLLAERGNETVHGVRVERIRHSHGRVECVYGRTDSKVASPLVGVGCSTVASPLVGGGCSSPTRGDATGGCSSPTRGYATGEQVEFGGEHFVSTMPLRELIHALDPPPPDEVLRAANRLRYRDYLTAVLIVKRAEVFPDNWIYIHSPEVAMGRIQNYKNWSPDMVPDPSRTSLGLEYFLWHTDDQWSWPQERLIELGIRECTQIGIIDPSEVEDGTVVRMEKAYPIYDQVYRESVETIRRYLDTFTNLQTVGRNGLHRYNNQDHSMLTGVYAAHNIAGAEYDVWAVNVEKEYHEEGRVAEAAPEDRAVPHRVPAAAGVPSPDALIEAVFARLDPAALGIAIGSVTGVGLFLATTVLLLKGGPMVGRTLSLLGNFLPGFTATWSGAFIGLVEAGVGGFAFGYTLAKLRNWGMSAYARMVKRRAEAAARRDLLDKV